MLRITMRCLILGLATLTTFYAQSSLIMKPSLDSDLIYPGAILEGTYNSAISKPEKFLGFEVGDRVATSLQIVESLEAWSSQSERIKVIEYARSHEGRPLHAVFISSPDNISRLDEIKSDIVRISDARKINDSEASQIIKELPAIAWMAYSIHGNETSGADAALASIYHLIASEDEKVSSMLDNMIVIIDPLMNPDGRDRFSKSLEQYRGTAPNVDDQSLLHTGDWPYGRTNHYFFDLNRDFFFLTQPETQGRVAMINEWRPQLMIDGHEMGSQDTFLMGPPRQPLNENIDKDLQKWAHIFAEEQAEAFDDRNWRYYTGEWFENLYPGYSNYSEYRGSMHILYEQSRMAEDGVRRPEGTVQTYKESVHHQFVSTIANLESLAKHSQAMYKDFWDGRKYNVSRSGRFADRSFVILANDNEGRLEDLVQRLEAQGIELYKNNEPIEVDQAIHQTGETNKKFNIPAGSLIIPNRQPDAPLVAAIMEFDAEFSKSVLIEERQKTLKDGSSIMYDTTAWNFSMMYGLPAVTVDQEITGELIPWQTTSTPIALDSNANAWTVNGNDDRSVAFAARLMEKGVNVRVVDQSTKISGAKISRGSVIVAKVDNPNVLNLSKLVSNEDKYLGTLVASISSGYSKGDLPDWGGRHFRLLSRPQIAILSHNGFNSYDVGASWWSIDHHLGIRHSQINSSFISRADLRRYNTIVMPSGSRNLNASETAMLSDWVKQGGTLIAHGWSTNSLASDEGIGTVRRVQDTFEKAQDYDLKVQRELLAENYKLEMKSVMSHYVDTETPYPWKSGAEILSEDELEKRDKWQSLFMPSGAMVAGRVDAEHWLTFGTPEILPLLYGNQPILMTHNQSEAVVRIGKLNKNYGSEEARALNWSTLPAGYDMQVRMSGLVWPEASQRIANSAYLTRERLGRGQVILFSGQPNFRGATRGTTRLWLNALVYGSGLGTSLKVNP